MKGGKAPTAHQKHWWDWLVEQGCSCCGAPAEIHHCIGSTARHNKIHIGNDFVIPLCPRHHRHEAAIDNNTAQFILDYYGEARDVTRKELEKAIFAGHVAHYRRQFDWLPVPADALMEIENYHR